MTLPVFCQRPKHHELKVGNWWRKTFSPQKYFSAKSFLWSRSLKVISLKSHTEGNFFSTKKISPKHPRNFCWQSKKEEYDEYFEKRFSPILSSGHERFSFNNPTKKPLAKHPHFPSPGMRGCEAQIPNRSLSKNLLLCTRRLFNFHSKFLLQKCPLNP